MSRRGHGSVKVPNVKLRPAPLQQETRVNSRPESTRPEESEEFGLQQEMAGDVPPLERVVVCITGIKETRSELQAIALSLGGKVQQALTADVTHLIAEGTSTPKYKCAIEYGIKVMRPSWLFALREAWLSGDVPDVDILEHTNHLRPFHNLYISLTGFDSDAEQRRRLMNAISSGGGTYKPTFVKSCTHLVVGPQFADHQTTLGSAKVLKAQDINALHEQKPLDQPHPIHIVWCEWLEDSRNLQGALDESKYSILNPRHLQIRVTSTKHLNTDEPTGRLSTSVKHSPILRRDSSVLADTSIANRTRSPTPLNTKKKPLPVDTSATGALRKKHRTNSSASLKSSTLSGLLDVDQQDDPDYHLNGDKDKLFQSSAHCLSGGRSLSQLVPPIPSSTTGSTRSQLNRFGNKNAFVPQTSQFSRSQPFAAHSSRKSSQATSNSTCAPKASTSKSVQAECKEQSGAEDTTPIFKGLRFALCSLEAKHVDAARAAIKMCGGRVTRVTDNLIDTTDEDVDWVITPLLHEENSSLDVQDSSLVAQSWIEKCIALDRYVEPDSFWAGRPIRTKPLSEFAQIKLALLSDYLDDFDTIIVQRICRSLNIQTTTSLDCPDISHAVISDHEDADRLHDGRPNASFIQTSRLLDLLKSLKSIERKPSSLALGQTGILQGCVVSLSKKVNSSYDRLAVTNQLHQLGAVLGSGVGTDITHLIHVGDLRGQEPKAANGKGIHVVHPLWLAECIKTESRALEWAFPSTFKSGTSLSFGLTPVSSATPRLSRGASAPQLDMHDDSIVTAGNSTDDLPPPIDVHLPAHSQPQLHSKPPASARVIRSQPHLEPTKSAGKPTEHLSEDCRHPADRTFDPIIPSNILNNSSGANSPRVQSPVKDSTPHASVNVLSGLKSLFGAKDDAHSSGTERDNGRARKQRRMALGKRGSSPTAALHSDDSDAFATSGYIRPGPGQLGQSVGQKRARSAFGMSQAPNEETQAAEESSMQITVVDPSAQAAKLRLLGKPLPPVEEPDPSSEDVIVIPASAPRRGRARRYREERV